jgi:hypothetical protein
VVIVGVLRSGRVPGYGAPSVKDVVSLMPKKSMFS